MVRVVDKHSASLWAWECLQDPDTLILDTETTGLGSDAEIVQIAIINLRGDVLIDTLVKPSGIIPDEASAIHGITLKTVEREPTFDQIAEQVRALLGRKMCLIYNTNYDVRLLQQSADAVGISTFKTQFARFQCVMLPYSAWVGEPGRSRGEYRWQRLPGGDHSALGDCRAVRRVLFKMASLEWLCDR